MTKYCPRCGAPNDDDPLFCTKCGNPLTPTYAVPQTVQPGPNPPNRLSRPTGVTILAALQIVFAIINLALATVLALLIPVLGVLFYIVPILNIIFAVALFGGRNWARILVMIGAVIELIDIPIGTIIGIVLLWYLTRPRVVEYFKRNR
ncbi:MAG: zinc ribbon domain-containing protein [Nitrososphaerota archaeon]|jgi:hypothetical protein|nr:zinc ribbon domain-containing protein [Nitrososphaerota archaeon]MDG7039116.1 zinc ribbon domain-containing protein [Nitrososphaerota archaeon]MDG7042657.1 zinc ribbon domain-containing protein [Nitrososphaerota archaeon]